MKLKLVCLCTFSLKTGGLVGKSHCNFDVLACVCEDHIQDLQVNFSSGSSRHSRILKSSYFTSGLVENRCRYKKDLLALLPTLASFGCFVLFQSECDICRRSANSYDSWLLMSFRSSPLPAQLRQIMASDLPYWFPISLRLATWEAKSVFITKINFTSGIKIDDNLCFF